LVSPSRQCSSILVGFVEEVLVQNKVTTLEYPLYSTDSVPVDFYVLSTDINNEGTAFFDACDIIKKATEKLKKLS
jgi:hypothetical protein